MDMSNYTVDAKTLNEYIDTINGWALSLANEQGIGYLDTQEILRDEKGFLRSDYQAGDGYHLSASAYNEILMYIRTHDFGE
jgi:lysophospholipase L1-like esterase